MQHIKLSELQKGEFGEILAIEAQDLELELMRLGLVTGDRVRMANAAPMGGPIAVEISGNKVAMRDGQNSCTVYTNQRLVTKFRNLFDDITESWLDSYSPRWMIMFLVADKYLCSHKKTPCQLPRANRPAITGIERLLAVNADLI